ncbi:hypothetical protein HHUSO_G31243 [Huso huso]|uniref:L1 transposable element RRM domain-containing protein n=1 Tax=Huso huso TaxID=61971 RepID=A0ABR0YCA8_HUSHU
MDTTNRLKLNESKIPSSAKKRAKVDSPTTSQDGDADTSSLSVIMREFSDIKQMLQSLIESQQKLQENITGIEKRVTGTEDRISKLEDNVFRLENQVKELSSEATKNNEKMQDLENRSRRNNIRIIGVTEGLEGNNCSEYVRRLLCELLGVDVLEKERPLEIERAHRSLAPKPRDWERPRPLIVRLLRFQDRQKILDLARSQLPKKMSRKLISIYPDFSAELQTKRRKYTPIRKFLREKNVRYGLIYPATLKVTYGNRSVLLKTVEEANAFIFENFNVSLEENDKM